MKKFFAFFLLGFGLVLASAAFAAEVSWDGGEGSTLDAPEEAYGDEPNQGTWHAEANS